MSQETDEFLLAGVAVVAAVFIGAMFTLAFLGWLATPYILAIADARPDGCADYRAGEMAACVEGLSQ